LLKFESDLVCAPFRHGKMIAAFHSLINTVMIERPGQLLHMDIVGPSRVRSIGGKWYVFLLLMTTLGTLRFSFWKANMRCLSTFGV
jgi:hypothetical protein